MQGDYVIARSFGDIPLVRRVWDEGEKVVYLCTEERYDQLAKGETDLLPVGFPKDDVFKYDRDILADLETNPYAWNKLELWVTRATRHNTRQ